MRLIDAEKLPNDKFWEGMTLKEKTKVLSWFLSAPTVDAVEVVRCKDCNYRVPISEQQHLYRGKPAMHCIWHSRLCRENDYCSYGERKDDVTDTNVGGKMDGKGVE